MGILEVALITDTVEGPTASITPSDNGTCIRITFFSIGFNTAIKTTVIHIHT